MKITGDRVKCANCGMIYDRPPDQKVFHIGVPFTVEGRTNCPKCGSNASDPLPNSFERYITKDASE